MGPQGQAAHVSGKTAAGVSKGCLVKIQHSSQVLFSFRMSFRVPLTTALPLEMGEGFLTLEAKLA